MFIFVLKQRSIIKIAILEGGFAFFLFFSSPPHNSACPQIGREKKRMQAINLLLKMKWRESEFPSFFFQSQVLRDSLLFVHLCASLDVTQSSPLHQDFSATKSEHCAPYKRHGNKGLNTSEWGAPSSSVSGMGDFKAMLHVFVLRPDHSWFFSCLLASGGSRGNNENSLKEKGVKWTSGGRKNIRVRVGPLRWIFP